VTISVASFCLALSCAWSAKPGIEPSNRIASVRGDTLEIVVPAGDTATIRLRESLVRLDVPRQWSTLRGGTLRIASAPLGSHALRIRSMVGRATKTVVVHVVPRARIDLQLVPLAVSPTPWTDSVNLGILRQELSKLMDGSGIDLRVAPGALVSLPPGPGSWDPAGSGHLDLLRNDDSLHPAPALDSLVGWMGRRDLVFPKVAIFQDPVRVGWGLGRSALAGDTLLLLANHTTFPWRDGRGAAIRYTLGSAGGERLDTFQVAGYRGDTLRIRSTAPDGRFRFAHDLKTDFVLRPDQASPPFGLSPSWRRGAAPLLILPDGRRLDDAKRAARVLAHEVCHTLGLHHRDEKTNLMCPILRMDVERQVLSPDQVLLLHGNLPPSH